MALHLLPKDSQELFTRSQIDVFPFLFAWLPMALAQFHHVKEYANTLSKQRYKEGLFIIMSWLAVVGYELAYAGKAWNSTFEWHSRRVFCHVLLCSIHEYCVKGYFRASFAQRSKVFNFMWFYAYWAAALEAHLTFPKLFFSLEKSHEHLVRMIGISALQATVLGYLCVTLFADQQAAFADAFARSKWNPFFEKNKPRRGRPGAAKRVRGIDLLKMELFGSQQDFERPDTFDLDNQGDDFEFGE